MSSQNPFIGLQNVLCLHPHGAGLQPTLGRYRVLWEKKYLQLFSRFAGASQCLHAHFFISSRNRTKNLTYVGGPDIGFRLISPSFFICMHMHALPFPKRKKCTLGKIWKLDFFWKKNSGQFAAPVTSPVAVLPFHFFPLMHFLCLLFWISKRRNPSIWQCEVCPKSLSICIRGGGCKMIFCPPPLGKHSPPPFSSGGRLRTKEEEEEERRVENALFPFPLSIKKEDASAPLSLIALYCIVYTRHGFNTAGKLRELIVCHQGMPLHICHFRTKKSGNLWTQLKNLYLWGGGITVVHVQNESLHSLLFPAATTTMSVPWSDGFERDKITRTALISAEKTIFMVNPFPGGIRRLFPFLAFCGKMTFN